MKNRNDIASEKSWEEMVLSNAVEWAHGESLFGIESVVELALLCKTYSIEMPYCIHKCFQCSPKPGKVVSRGSRSLQKRTLVLLENLRTAILKGENT